MDITKLSWPSDRRLFRGDRLAHRSRPLLWVVLVVAVVAGAYGFTVLA